MDNKLTSNKVTHLLLNKKANKWQKIKSKLLLHKNYIGDFGNKKSVPRRAYVGAYVKPGTQYQLHQVKSVVSSGVMILIGSVSVRL